MKIDPEGRKEAISACSSGDDRAGWWLDSLSPLAKKRYLAFKSGHREDPPGPDPVRSEIMRQVQKNRKTQVSQDLDD